MKCYPFIEAEKRAGRKVARTCELLKVSRAAYSVELSNKGALTCGGTRCLRRISIGASQ